MTLRRLCSLLGAQPLFTTLSYILAEEADLPFGAAIVQALNLILLTAPEVFALPLPSPPLLLPLLLLLSPSPSPLPILSRLLSSSLLPSRPSSSSTVSSRCPPATSEAGCRPVLLRSRHLFPFPALWVRLPRGLR